MSSLLVDEEMFKSYVGSLPFLSDVSRNIHTDVYRKNKPKIKVQISFGCATTKIAYYIFKLGPKNCIYQSTEPATWLCFQSHLLACRISLKSYKILMEFGENWGVFYEGFQFAFTIATPDKALF